MISIIVPIYNAERYLHHCIDSLCAQTYTSLEILLINDGSTDRSGEICEKYAQQDVRIKVFHKKNGGVSSARNLGIREAQGEYFVCVDSDDYVEADYISALIDAQQKYPEAGHIWCCFQTVSDYEKADAKPYLSGKEEYVLFDRKHIMLLHNMWMDTMPWGRLYSTQLVKSHGLSMEEGRSIGEDMLFHYAYLDAEKSTDIVIVNRPLYNYVRTNNDSLDQKYYDNLLNLYEDGCNRIKSYLDKWNVGADQMQIFYNDYFYKYERVLRNTMRLENKRSFLKKIRYNNSILRSSKFCEVFERFTGQIHLAYRWAYRLRCYLFVLWLDKLVALKRCLRPH